MKVDRISYQKIFPTGMMYLNHKIGVEVQVDDGEDIDKAFRLAVLHVERWNQETNPSMAATMEYMKPSEGAGEFSFNQKTGTITTSPTKDERIQSFIATINMCTSLKFLENFKKRVEQENNNDLFGAYNKKYHELLEKENQNPTINHL